jgi:hypothetical protein
MKLLNKLLNRLSKYFKFNSLYNVYDYPNIKYSISDLIEGDTIGDLITEYQGIPSRLRRRTGHVKIDPIIDSVLEILKNKDIEVKSISNFLLNYSGSKMVFYLRFDNTDEFPPYDIIEYYEQYIDAALKKLRDEYKLKYNLPPNCRLFLYNLKSDKLDDFNNSPICLYESSRTRDFKKIEVTQISLEIETNI